MKTLSPAIIKVRNVLTGAVLPFYQQVKVIKPIAPATIGVLPSVGNANVLYVIIDGATFTSYVYSDGTWAESGGGVDQIQSDYTQTDNTEVDYIKNKLLLTNQTITLVVADWSANSQTIALVGITPNSQVVPTMSRVNRDLYSAADIVGTNGTDEIVFTCITTPTVDIVVPLDITK